MLRKSSTATCTGPADTITERLHFPATAQNQQAIWEVLGPLAASAEGSILEVASGSGEHLAYFSEQNRQVSWQGSDPEPEHRASIQAWNPSLPEPLNLDVTAWSCTQTWGGLVAINLLHISPWEATAGLMRAAATYLHPQGWLYLYGAYLRKDGPNAPSNLAFDQGLRAQNPQWGVRWLDEVVKEAELNRLRLDSIQDMPSNNFSLIFRPVAT